jgi:hypothetical protein
MRGRVERLCFSPDGRTLAGADASGHVSVWTWSEP